MDNYSIIRTGNSLIYKENLYKESSYWLIKIKGNLAIIEKDNQTVEVKRMSGDAFLFNGYLLFDGKVYEKSCCELPANDELIIPLNKRHKLINADNLVALNVMKKTFRNSIDCIIIDPPYNTKNKLMKYNDVFENGYLVFMGNRLRESYDLLNDESVVFVHINHYELFRLKLLMDEIFGEENFIENIVWMKNSIKNNSKTISNNHEYILCYAKNKNKIKKLNYFRKKKEGVEEIERIRQSIINDSSLSIEQKRILIQNKLKELYGNELKHLKGIKQYKYVDEELNVYRISDVSAPNKNGCLFNVVHPVTKKICAMPSGGYRFSLNKMNILIKNNLLHFGKDETTVPQFKRYLKDVEDEVCKSVIVNFDEGYNDLKKIIPDADFNNPKPVSLICELLNMINKNQFTVLDFFAGSGTIIEAVSKIKDKQISCIAITNNENNICEDITYKRFKLTVKDFEYYEI